MPQAVPPHAPSFALRRLWAAVGWLLLAGVVAGSLLPASPQSAFSLADKLQHFLAYGTVTFWFAVIYPGLARQLALVVAFMLLGTALELLQGATSSRIPDIADVLANGVGASLGFVLARSPLSGLPFWIERGLGRFGR